MTEQEKLLNALLEAAIYGKSFPTRTPEYTASIERDPDASWQHRRIKARLVIRCQDTLPDLLAMAVFPIFLSVDVAGETALLTWELPANPWMHWEYLIEQWPVTPGPFLWKPEGITHG